MASSHCLPSPSSHAHPVTKTFYDSQEPYTIPSIEVELRGLTGEQRRHAWEMFCPVVRRSSTHNEFPIQHLDVVSCWKGISCRQASEIMFWEAVFKESLEKLVAQELLDAFGEELRTTHGKILLSHLLELSPHSQPFQNANHSSKIPATMTACCLVLGIMSYSEAPNASRSTCTTSYV